MSTQTPNLNLDLREASDIFNPLSTNSNFETLDSVISGIQKKGGIVTYTTTASANLLKLSDNPTPNETVFKFVAAGDANTWSYQETVNNIVSLDGIQKTVKAGEMYVAWVNAANAMVVIAWPDVVNAQTFDGKGPAEWATNVQLDAVNQTAQNAVTTAQAAATVANNALEVANSALAKGGFTLTLVYQNNSTADQGAGVLNLTNVPTDLHGFYIVSRGSGNSTPNIPTANSAGCTASLLLDSNKQGACELIYYNHDYETTGFRSITYGYFRANAMYITAGRTTAFGSDNSMCIIKEIYAF